MGSSPRPTVGTLVLDSTGERWVVNYADSRVIHLTPTYDNPRSQHPDPLLVVHRSQWPSLFNQRGWLTV